MKTPTIKEITQVVSYAKDLAKQFSEEYITMTVGFSPDSGQWDYQSGDNSFSGGAYFHPIWGVVDVYKNSNCRELAKDIINQIKDQIE
jgi:hypothetical protein